MKHISNVIGAIALVVIAGNMTFNNVRSAKETVTKPAPTTKVVEVVGRAWHTFDGFGHIAGFLAKDGDNLVIVPYDKGSMASSPAWQPKFVTIYDHTGDGKSLVIDPITVEPFN